MSRGKLIVVNAGYPVETYRLMELLSKYISKKGILVNTHSNNHLLTNEMVEEKLSNGQTILVTNYVPETMVRLSSKTNGTPKDMVDIINIKMAGAKCNIEPDLTIIVSFCTQEGQSKEQPIIKKTNLTDPVEILLMKERNLGYHKYSEGELNNPKVKSFFINDSVIEIVIDVIEVVNNQYIFEETV